MSRAAPFFLARCCHLAIAAALFLAAMGTRKFRHSLPTLIAQYGGDTLWPTMVCFAVRVLAAEAATLKVGVSVLTLAYTVEISQLYSAPWIDGIRSTFIGGLVLGRGFLASDLVCYAIGIVLFILIDPIVAKALARRDTNNLISNPR